MQLPVYEIESELSAPFQPEEWKRILLKAPTGSGKSTAVPGMLLPNCEGMIVVVQPRRIAARMLAKRVAELKGVILGEEVGYVVRFDKRMSKTTRIVFVTDGIFQNWCDSNPQLEGIGAVLFDEFHERRVASDLTLAKCLNLQERSRKDLLLVVMSATLEMQNLSEYLGQCREIEAGGRAYPVAIEHLSEPLQKRGFQHNSREGIWDRCVDTAKKAIKNPDAGHILIFLPGVHEIRKTVDLLESSSVFREWKVCPLYSALSPRLQDEAVAPSTQPKIIVATNVAETSLTIDGVRTVIDAGLARVSEFDPVRGVETLLVQPISQAAASQRAGRAGRTAPGKCIRLWSQTNHARRKAFELPEIRRTDVAELFLKLAVQGEDIESFRWLDAPLSESVELAKQTLEFIGAIDREAKPTGLGKLLTSFPLPPRFARLIFAGQEEGCLAEMCFVAAAIQGEGIFTKRKGTIGRADFIYATDPCDFAGEFRAFEAAMQIEFNPRRCGEMGILARGAREVNQALKQIHDAVDREGLERQKVNFERNAEKVVRAAVKAFGDRIGTRHNQNSLACKLSDGRRGMLDSESCAKKADLFIPTEITEVDGKDVVVHFKRCFALSRDLLFESFSEDIEEQEEVEYDPISRRVERKLITCYKGLRLFEKAGGSPDADLSSALLAEYVAKGELKLNKWDNSVELWIARLLGLREWMPELELPDFTEEDRAIALEQVCAGASSYKEIKNRDVLPALKSWLSQGQHASLNAYAPTEIVLSNGKQAKVYYEKGKRPWIAMRAQLLFGVKETPKIADGRVKLHVHICAPNNRPWQITDDLAGFWEKGFEQMRKDLGGRYPKHQWTLD